MCVCVHIYICLYIYCKYKTFHAKTKEHTLSHHGILSKTENITGHKTDLNIYQKIKLIPCFLSDHYGERVVFNSNKNNRKSTYIWKLNNTQ